MGQPTEVWKKASFSGGQNGDCVEVSNRGGVRDSKNPATELPGRVNLAVFLDVLKSGRSGR